MAPIARANITGLVLAGGLGTRMGGQDKGLMPYRGEPLVSHVLQRFAPQVGALLISANRHPDIYARCAQPWRDSHAAAVLGDDVPAGVDAFAGPLAGILTGLRHCATPYLAVVPCDAPHLPLDLVDQLAQALHPGDAATLATDGQRRHPTLCLLHRHLADDLGLYLAQGHRKLDGCLARWQAREVLFADSAAFRNVNSPEQLIA